MLRRICQTSLETNRKKDQVFGCYNGKEFLSSAFKEYLSTQGTVLQDIPDYTPEIERNRGKKYPHYHKYMLKVMDCSRIYGLKLW
jgi:hypothetical protein